MSDPPPPALSPLSHENASQRRFLFLQGPHGPFFAQLGQQLQASGAKVWRVGFNAGDRFFWPDRANFIPHYGAPEDWPAHLEQILRDKAVTDIVLYGDVRPIHAAARDLAKQRGLTLHVFEEGYLRPYWITYERGGSNGHSALMRISIDDMTAALRGHQAEIVRPPATWGDMRQHKFYGVVYHFMVAVRNKDFYGFRPHRQVSVMAEFWLHLRRVLALPFQALARRAEAEAIRRGGFPYTLVLLQLEHDSNFRAHSPFATMSEFTDQCLTTFAAHAPRHHHIVFKTHPLEDDRAGVRQAIRQKAQQLGISDRVHIVRGGKLARLLAQARSAITVNSTAAQQALWRGLPVKAMGRAVYDKPGLVSDQSLVDFMTQPERPNAALYRTYRDYLLESSQLPGGFYARASRAHVLRLVTDMMLDPLDPYETLAQGKVTHRQQFDRSEQ